MKLAKIGFFALIAAFMLITLSACAKGNNRSSDNRINPLPSEISDQSQAGIENPTSDEQSPPDPVLPYYSELLRTYEFFTLEQMETLKSSASSWQSAKGGVCDFADIVVIEPSDGSIQQVYVCGESDDALYEKMQIQTLNGAQARIIYTGGSASSCQLILAYEFITEDIQI